MRRYMRDNPWVYVGCCAVVCIAAVLLSAKYGFRYATVRDLNSTNEQLDRIEKKLDQLIKGNAR